MLRSKILLIFTFFIALMLAILPLPSWSEWLRPAWVVLLVIYWLVVVPYSVTLGGAWFLGLLLDMLNGTLLGEHALAMCVVAFLTLKCYRQLRVFPLWQQALCVFLLVFIYQFIIFVIQGITGQLVTNALYWLTPIITMLLWPWLFVLFRNSRRRFVV